MSSPRALNLSPAKVTKTSESGVGAMPIWTQIWRRWSWARIVPERPTAAPIIAAGLPRAMECPGGRDIQSSAFFRPPGME